MSLPDANRQSIGKSSSCVDVFRFCVGFSVMIWPFNMNIQLAPFAWSLYWSWTTWTSDNGSRHGLWSFGLGPIGGCAGLTQQEHRP